MLFWSPALLVILTFCVNSKGHEEKHHLIHMALTSLKKCSSKKQKSFKRWKPVFPEAVGVTLPC